nr:EOG090X047B [Eubosmina coregoni]
MMDCNPRECQPEPTLRKVMALAANRRRRHIDAEGLIWLGEEMMALMDRFTSGPFSRSFRTRKEWEEYQICVFSISNACQKGRYIKLKDRRDYAVATRAVHLRSARRLLKLCEANGGAFIKVGQHLGALDYLIPFEYVRTMRVLHSKAPQSDFEAILNVIKEDLGCEPSAVFRDIEKVPLGTASLAQVHKATLMDGTVVAVKVQHPLVKMFSQVDIKCMELLANVAAWCFPDFKLQWLVDETKRNLPCELNFIMEGKNSEKTASLMNHLPWLHVPKVYWDYSTQRVLTMEYCNGLDVGDLSTSTETKYDHHKKEISRRITQLFSDMIFLHGYVHCDPHPGNLRIEIDNKDKLTIHLLDHGLYTQLPTELRENYSRFWMAIINSNVKEIELIGKKLGVGDMFGLFACMTSGRSWNAIQGGIDKLKKSAAEEKEIKDDASKYLVEIIEVLHRVPREMLLIFKTNDLLRGLDSMLGVKNNTASFVTMSRSCANANYLHNYSLCKSQLSKIHVNLSSYMAHLRITIYQVFLWWASWWDSTIKN